MGQARVLAAAGPHSRQCGSGPTGRRKGFAAAVPEAAADDAETAVVAHLLGPRVTFIGEPLTRRLIMRARSVRQL